MTNLFKGPKKRIYRKIEVEDAEREYYILVNAPNIADNIYVDAHDPPDAVFKGFGGSTLRFELEDGTVAEVVGPWHTNSGALLKDTGLDVRDLHATKVTIWSTKPGIWRGKGYVKGENNRLIWTDVERDIFEKDEVIYEEELPVLGMFYRGERMAHAYANATGRTVYFRSESYGGSSEKQVSPGDEMHPLAKRCE